ncbi:MAG: hypothetical protein RIR70_1427 [Pseudomonadota bacterium]|jgi:Ca2+-binding RTX toxin-like protein
MLPPTLIEGASASRNVNDAALPTEPVAAPLCPEEAAHSALDEAPSDLEHTSQSGNPWDLLAAVMRGLDSAKATEDTPAAREEKAPEVTLRSLPQNEAAAVKLSGNILVDSLLEGTKWGETTPGTGVTLTYSFKNDDTIEIAPSNPDYAKNPWYLDDDQKQAVRDALSRWSDVANITFVEVEDTPDSQGDLRFAGTYNTPEKRTAEAAPLLAGNVPENGDIWLGKRFADETDEASLKPGGYAFMAIMHEVGHVLGLKHPHDTSPTNSLLTPKESDNQRQTVMSYTLDYSVSPEGPQPLDIAAIQYLYGPNTQAHTGDTTYQFDPDTPVFRTLWDAGGGNTLDASNQNSAVNLDLTEGGRSSIGPLIVDNNPSVAGPTESNDYLTIATGSVVQNAIGSPYDDYIWGSSKGNKLEGGPGNDTLYGNAGDDRAIYRVTDSPADAKIVDDESLPNAWHLVNKEGRTLLDIRESWDGNGLVVEDVRADKDVPEGASRLGKDLLVDVETIDWSVPVEKKD